MACTIQACRFPGINLLRRLGKTCFGQCCFVTSSDNQVDDSSLRHLDVKDEKQMKGRLSRRVQGMSRSLPEKRSKPLVEKIKESGPSRSLLKFQQEQAEKIKTAIRADDSSTILAFLRSVPSTIVIGPIDKAISRSKKTN